MPEKLPIPRKGGILAGAAGVIGSGVLWLIGFKLVASWLGPEGVGLFSQLRQIAQAATISATFGGSNTIVQGIASRNLEVERRQFRTTAATLVGVAGTIVVAMIALIAPEIAHFSLSSKSPDLVVAIYWVGLAISLNIAGTYALAILNGYQSYVYLAAAQIAGPTALATLLSTCWWWRLPLNPTLIAQSFVLCFGVTCIVGWFGIARLPRRHSTLTFGKMPDTERRIFFRFAASNLLAALSSTAALLLIRSWIIGAQGLAFAGLFDASWTLTFNYATIFLSACNAFYFPALTAATSPEKQRVCVLKMAYFVLGTFVLIFYTLVLFRDAFITLLYSPQFLPSSPALQILAIAIIFRAISWVYGSTILATRQSLVLLMSELILNITLLATTRYALTSGLASLEALSWAFVIPHFLYLIFSIEFACSRNSSLHRLSIWPLLLATTLPFLHLLFNQNQTSVFSFAEYFFLFSGLLIVITTFFAYRHTNFKPDVLEIRGSNH